MGRLPSIWNRLEYFYIVWQCNDIYNTIREKYIWEFLADVAGQAGDADSSRAPGLTPGSWTEPGALECPSQFTTVTPRRWCISFFMWYIHNCFHIFQRIALNWIHSFANWRNVWHVTIIWPIWSVTIRNKYILHSHWNWFYESSVLCPPF